DAGKLMRELGWQPEVPFGAGLMKTVQWYLAQSNPPTGEGAQ
ncbi:MAG TPA: dTDP-glucose 4,6-dehydratase, partial [Telluria sp.]